MALAVPARSPSARPRPAHVDCTGTRPVERHRPTANRP
jgi:hypothetical protein